MNSFRRCGLLATTLGLGSGCPSDNTTQVFFTTSGDETGSSSGHDASVTDASMSSTLTSEPGTSTDDPTLTTSEPDSSGAHDSSTSAGSSDEAGSSSSSSEGGPADADEDGVADEDDNCVDVPNEGQGDADSDTVGDFCDTEVINDGTTLYVPAGTVFNLDFYACYSAEVRIYGTVYVPRQSEGGNGFLVFYAPRIVLGAGGVIDANAGGSVGGLPGPDAGGYGGGGSGGACGGGIGAGVGQGGSGAGYGGGGGVPTDTYGMQDCDACSGATVAHCIGIPGPVHGTDEESDIELGSGGGAGGNSSGCTNVGGRGGNGGGAIVFFASERAVIDGEIWVDGESPPPDPGACGYRPGGGGGSGGGVLISAPEVVGAATGSITARGGAGGYAAGYIDDAGWGWGGGGGGAGRVKIFGPATSFDGTVVVDGGAGGDSADVANYGFVGTPGGNGVFSQVDEIPEDLASATCPL
jgi:hypothetical protein